MLGIITFFLYAGFLIFITWLIAYTPHKVRVIIAYIFFFTTPAFAYFGLIGPLTGFDRTSSSYFGLSFLMPFLALILLTQTERIRSNPLQFIGVSVNPIYMTCGPFPKSTRLNIRFNWRSLKRRFRVLQGDFIIGAFFVSFIAPSFGFQNLKSSIQPVDILVFSGLFEGYVYFNFAGYSMLAWGLMKLLGMDAPRNFALPFSARSVVEYWQRWHVSMSNVLGQLFYAPSKKYLGVYGAATATFMASALWHGVTVNFILWGLLHAACWSQSRWLYLRGSHAWIQILLMVFSIIVGRILFVESNSSLLILKINSLFDLSQWSTFGIFKHFYEIGIKAQLGILIGLILITIEIIFSKKSSYTRNYIHLKKPWTSILLLTCTVFLGVYVDEGAIYGRR